MKLTKKDWPKLYGPNGLYSKSDYIKKVISSCNTTDQVRTTVKWGIDVIDNDLTKNRENLNPPFSLLPNEIIYMIDFDNYYYEICREIRKFAKNKEKELSNDQKERD